MKYNNVLEVIGNTPLVRLNQISKHLPCNLYVKLEYMNPAGSIKDRIGWYLIEDAVKKGNLKPGGTIVECTSGNTGAGLAIAAAIKGYKCVFVLPDKISEEKIQNLRSFGARVVVTPTHVEPTDPRSYYSVAERIAKETPNAFWMGQYNNLANRECHYLHTAPEIWNQFPEIDYFFAGIGTGGTICGVSKYLKEKKPSVKTIAIDPVGSIVEDVFKHGKPLKEAKTYKVEGIGEDFIPDNYDFSVLDDVIQVTDRESFRMNRRLLHEEALYCGGSCGAAVAGTIKWLENHLDEIKGKNGLIILPDSAARYLSKSFNDNWMREHGFIDAGESCGSIEYIK